MNFTSQFTVETICWLLIKCYCCRYNGHLPSGDKGRKKSKFILGKKVTGNGVKPFRKHVVKNAQAAKV